MKLKWLRQKWDLMERIPPICRDGVVSTHSCHQQHRHRQEALTTFLFLLGYDFFLSYSAMASFTVTGNWHTDNSWSYCGTRTQREWFSVSEWKILEFWLVCLGQVSSCGPINNEGAEQSHVGSTHCRAGVEQALCSAGPRVIGWCPSHHSPCPPSPVHRTGHPKAA